MKISLLSRRVPMLLLLLMVLAARVIAAPWPHAANAINNDSSKIGVMAQEYADGNIAEILMITYDESQPALARFGYRNPEIDSFNRAIRFGILQKYEEFMETNQDGHMIEIRSYPFTSDEYLQIVMTSVTYPAYGTDGDLTSYNFDKKENRFMDLASIMTKLELDASTLAQRVRSLYVPTLPSQSVAAVTATGFLINRGPSGPTTQLLLEVVIEQAESEPWKHFYVYTPELNDLTQLNPYCLFDPNDMDQLDPPLSYKRIADEHATIIFTDNE